MARRVRLPLAELVEGDRSLGDAEAHYLGRVHRLAPGDTFLGFDVQRGVEADATLVSWSRGNAICRVGPPRLATRRPLAPVRLLQGLGKAGKPDRVLKDATALGATEIVFFLSERAVPRGRGESERDGRFRRLALDAARQSERGDVPNVVGPISFAESIERARLEPGVRCCLVPDANRALFERLQAEPIATPVTLLVGPEGGLSDVECQAAEASGFEAVRLGRFVLRTETAAAAALAVVVARW
jgi:16S rRNA (uracil1498-N3)-methyltransferase